MASVEHNRSKNTSVLSEIYKELSSVMEDYGISAASRIFHLIENGLRIKLANLAATNSVFSTCSDNIFSYCRQLMDSYTNIVNSVSALQASIVSEPVRSIFFGVVSILESRLTYFGELTTNELDPVLDEKNRIVDEACKIFSSNFHKLVDNAGLTIVRENVQNGLSLFSGGFNYNSALIYSTLINERIADELYELFYSIFAKEYSNCVLILDNMDKRRQMSFFYDLLKNEYSELSVIVTKQIFEIESKIPGIEKDGAEYNAVFAVLSLLRETYQYTGKLLSDLGECFEYARNNRLSEYTYDEFKDYLTSFISGDNVLSVAECDRVSSTFNDKLASLKSEYESVLKNRAASGLAETSLGHIIYHIKKYVSDNAMMSDSLKSAFLKIEDYYEANTGELEILKNFDIINGIYDTVKIKAQCLEENKEILNETAQTLVDSSKELIPNLSEEEIVKLKETGIKNWFESNSEAPDFDELFMSESYQLFLEKRKKQHDALLDSVTKKSLEYKKDHLLFEISTYEEIMNYSVSRLKESNDPKALEFVAVCDSTFCELISSLKRNNIVSIMPEPHDMFNAREHEVLMAEKNDGYQKGEIIKLMNSGYKQDDVIIMRANVIAAK